MHCYLCGDTHSITNDHVPPKGFFPEPRPSNLITVPCCARCNHAFSKDDEAVRTWLCTVIGATPAGEWILNKKVVPGIMTRSPAFRESLLNSILGKMKIWQTTHKGHQIRVENGWFSGERLIVDGKAQDERRGFAFRSELSGRIKSGDGAGEPIRVSLGGWFVIGCHIFVDDELIQMNSP
jgi:hypothetical protein